MFSKLRERCSYWLTHYLPDEATGRNAWHSAIDGMWYTVMVGLTQPFMTLFALSLGATDQMIGFLSSWPSLVSLVAQVPAAMMTARLLLIKKPLIRWAMLHRINYLIFALLPFLPVDGIVKAWIFVILVALMNFPAVVVNTMWTQLIGKLFPPRYRGQVMADRSFLVGIVTLIFLLVAGPILDIVPYPFNYSLNFGIAFFALMMSIRSLSKFEEKASEPAESAATASPWSGIGTVIKDKPFLGFVAAAFIMNIGFGISSSMWTLFYTRQLFISSTEIGFISIVSTLSSIIWYRIVPKFMDRTGFKNTFLLSYALYMPVPFLYSLVQPDRIWMLYLFTIVDGMAGATNNVSFINVILDSASDESQRPSYLAFFNICASIAGVIFPMVGMQIYLSLGGNDTRPIFWISSAVRLTAVILMTIVLNARRKGHSAGEVTVTTEE